MPRSLLANVRAEAEKVWARAHGGRRRPRRAHRLRPVLPTAEGVGGLCAGEELPAEFGEFVYQILGVLAGEGGAIDFRAQHCGRRKVGTARQAEFFRSSRQVEQFGFASADAARCRGFLLNAM